MTTRTTHRRHSSEFKRQVCLEIRSGALGRREAQRMYQLSDNLLQRWLGQFDVGILGDDVLVLPPPPVESDAAHAECLAQIAALQRKVGQLTMALNAHRAQAGSATSPDVAPRRVGKVSPSRSDVADAGTRKRRA
jgi:transposase